jgi:type I restriction enzyme S subunit
MKHIPLTLHAPLTNDRVTRFPGERRYLATGSVNDDGSFAQEMVTYARRPSRADLQVRCGDVCFARMNHTKKVLQIGSNDTDCILSTGFAVLRPHPEVLSSDFVRHWLGSDAFQLAKDLLCTGATQKAITNEKIESLTIPSLPLAEQRRIAAILDAADALRTKRRESIEQLDSLIQATFQEMFGDPVTNPKGWRLVTLADICDIQTGYAWKSKQFNSDGVGTPVIRIQNVGTPGSELIHTEEPPIGRFWVEPSELLLTLSGSFRLAKWSGPRALLNQRIARLTVKPGVSASYIEQALVTRLHAIEAMGRHSLVNNVAMADLRELAMILPPPELQARFAARIEFIEQQKLRLGAHLTELDLLFASLQSRAFNGELVA